MKWKDSYEEDQTEEEVDGDYLDEETYSPWKKGASLSKWFANPAVIYGAAIAGILILVMALWSVLATSGGQSYDEEIKALDQRLIRIEDQLKKTDDLLGSISRIDMQERKIDQLRGRFDRMEAALALRMDHVSKQLDGLKSGSIPLGPKKAVRKTAPTVAAKQPAKPAKPVKLIPARYHTVQAGDTLYNISKQYRLTADQLRKMNKLAGTKITLGQKLLVSPARRQ